MRARFFLIVAASVAALAVSVVSAGASPVLHVPAHAAGSLSRSQAAAVHAAVRAGTVAKTRGVGARCGDHRLLCQSQVITTAPGSKRPLDSESGQLGYSAAELEKAYGLSKAPAGAHTVAVVETGTYPNLESDLGVYRYFNNLPDCTVDSGCLKIVNKTGGSRLQATPRDDELRYFEEDVAVETALDVDMVSAACPKCHIVVVDLPIQDAFSTRDDGLPSKAQFDDYATGIKTAVKLGARSVSLSYGLPTTHYSDTGAPAKALAIKNVALYASTGDSGANGDDPAWPSNLPTVIAAGGTSLYPQGNHYAQTAWNQAGSGCSRDLPPAIGQPKAISKVCGGHRASSDISADADPFTGVSVYDSYAPESGFPLGFLMVGGTSASAPFLAAVNARAGVRTGTYGPNKLYKAPAGTFTDITIGSNAPPGACPEDNQLSCNADVGWDGPTGLGTPSGLASFQH